MSSFPSIIGIIRSVMTRSGLTPPQDLERGGAVDRFVDLIATVFEDMAQDETDIGLVVNDQNLFHPLPTLGPSKNPNFDQQI